jgi:quinol-cytochrome oxidoreductase complex cytochrome b subunit
MEGGKRKKEREREKKEGRKEGRREGRKASLKFVELHSRKGWIFVVVFVLFFEIVSLYSPQWPKTHNPASSVSRVLRLQACTTKN